MASLLSPEDKAQYHADEIQRATYGVTPPADGKRKAWEAKEQEFLGAKGIKPGAPAIAPGAAEGTSPQTPKATPTSTDNKEPLR